MCHLSIEKALKGLYVSILQEMPPKTHNLIYLVEKIKVELPDHLSSFLSTMNGVSVLTRYPDDLKKMQKVYNKARTKVLLESSKDLLKWLKAKT